MLRSYSEGRCRMSEAEMRSAVRRWLNTYVQAYVSDCDIALLAASLGVPLNAAKGILQDVIMGVPSSGAEGADAE